MDRSRTLAGVAGGRERAGGRLARHHRREDHDLGGDGVLLEEREEVGGSADAVPRRAERAGDVSGEDPRRGDDSDLDHRPESSATGAILEPPAARGDGSTTV